jgi:hypothetical protein
MALESCCAPSGAATYCPRHAAAMRGPSAADGEALIKALAPILDR